MAQQQAQITILEEREPHEYHFTEAEVEEYAQHLGVDLEFDRDLLEIARAGLQMPLPKDWRACQAEGQEHIFFFNTVTGDSVWDDPCDNLQREEVRLAIEQRVTVVLTLFAERGEEEGGLTIGARNLAGATVAVASFAKPSETTFAEAREELLGRVEASLAKGSVLRLLLPDSTMLGHSAGSRLLSELFA